MTKKKGYLNNKDFIELLKQYEELNDDTSRWFDKKNPEKDAERKLRKKYAKVKGYTFKKDDEYKSLVEWNKEFKKRKNDFYDKRVYFLKNETDEEREIREKKLEIIKNKLGKCFLAIAENFIKKPNFINYDYFRKGSMVSDACMFMYSYVERFNLRLDNPFAYFSQVANSAFLQHINKTKKQDEKSPPVSFIENVMGEKLDEGQYT